MRGEGEGRTGDGNAGDNSATVAGAGGAGRLEHGRAGDVVAGGRAQGSGSRQSGLSSGITRSKEWQENVSCSKRGRNNGSGIGRSRWSGRNIVA